MRRNKSAFIIFLLLGHYSLGISNSNVQTGLIIIHYKEKSRLSTFSHPNLFKKKKAPFSLEGKVSIIHSGKKENPTRSGWSLYTCVLCSQAGPAALHFITYPWVTSLRILLCIPRAGWLSCDFSRNSFHTHSSHLSIPPTVHGMLELPT